MTMLASKVLVAACLTLYLSGTCDAYSSGQVTQSCGNLTPSPPNHGAVTGGSGDLTVTLHQAAAQQTSYRAGETYTITLSRSGGQFRGFLCQVRDGDNIIGEVVPDSAVTTYQGLQCSSPTTIMNAASHTSSDDKSSISYTWRASGTTPASVRVRCAVVISQPSQVWYSIQSAAITLTGPAATQAPTTAASTAATSSPPAAGSQVQIDLSGCGRTKGCRRLPDGCNSAAACTYIYTQQLINNSTIQIELSAQAEGWVAVGYSTDNRMGSDDVLGCQADSTGRVFVKNLFNNGYSNILDNSTSPTLGMSSITTSLTNGVIACRFQRSIAGSGSWDLNLRTAHTLFFTSHASARAAADQPLTTQHATIPTLSTSPVSVTSNFSIGSSTFDPALLVAHGIMMTYSWLALSVNGMFTARFMRANYPPPKWFQYHWVIMAITIVLAVTAVILIAVHVGGYRASVHAGLGITVMVLTAVQVCLAIVRPAPDAGEKRRMFVMAHRSIAFLCQVLGWATMFLGLHEASTKIVISDSHYGVLGGGVGGVVLIWIFLEVKKSAAGEKGEMDKKFMSYASIVMGVVSYGFTIALGSLLWSADVRQ